MSIEQPELSVLKAKSSLETEEDAKSEDAQDARSEKVEEPEDDKLPEQDKNLLHLNIDMDFYD